MIRLSLSLAAAAATLGAAAPAAEVQRLQGLFCNTEAQIDRAIASIAAGLSPRRAAEIANRDDIVCTYIDRIEYVIAGAVALGDTSLPLVKYRGALVGVVVGDALRPVTPEAELYFLTPRQIAGAAIERQI